MSLPITKHHLLDNPGTPLLHLVHKTDLPYCTLSRGLHKTLDIVLAANTAVCRARIYNDGHAKKDNNRRPFDEAKARRRSTRRAAKFIQAERGRKEEVEEEEERQEAEKRWYTSGAPVTSLSKARSQAHFLERTGDRRRASEGLQDKGTEWKVTYPRILARAARNAKGSTAKGSTALARAERGVATVAAVHADSLSTTTTATADRLDMLFDELDGNKDGMLTPREIILALRKNPTLAARLGLPANIREGATRDRLMQYFHSIDSDQNDEISRDEFLRFAKLARRKEQAVARKKELTQ